MTDSKHREDSGKECEHTAVDECLEEIDGEWTITFSHCLDCGQEWDGEVP